MSNQPIIEAGYRVHVSTWENDGDNYCTQSMQGLEKDMVRLIVDFCKLHGDACNEDDSSTHGNLYDPSEGEKEAYEQAIRELIAAHAGVMYQGEPVDRDAIDDIAIMLELRTDVFYTRVFESISIDFVPHSIAVGDVTAEFV